MLVPHGELLFGAGFLAGAMNAAAGGGSFVTLPTLVFAGVPSVAANASSTVALFPGSFASAWAYRDDFVPFELISLRKMLAVSLTGGIAGALLLLVTSASTFDRIVPWLLLVGTLAFAFGNRAGLLLRRYIRIDARLMFICQFFLGVYGGYFGGAVGIMMMATWNLFGITDIKAMNATKTLVVGATNAVAVVCFVAAGKIWWPQTLVMLSAAVLGGYVGARLARRLPPQRIRLGICIFNALITAVFFVRTFG